MNQYKELSAKASKGPATVYEHRISSIISYRVMRCDMIICECRRESEARLISHTLNNFDNLLKQALDMFDILAGRECANEEQWKQALKEAQEVKS